MFEYHNPICLHLFCVRLACVLIFLSAYVSAVLCLALCIYETQKKQNQTKMKNVQAGDITKEYTPLSPRTQNAQAGDITKEYTPLSPRTESPVSASPLPLSMPLLCLCVCLSLCLPWFIRLCTCACECEVFLDNLTETECSCTTIRSKHVTRHTDRGVMFCQRRGDRSQ